MTVLQARPGEMQTRTGTKAGRPHWSYSQLSQFTRCPLQFFFERVARLPRPFSSTGMLLGSAVHEGLAVYHRKLRQQQEVPSDEVKAAFLQAWQDSETERPVQYKEGETRGELLDQGITLLETYLAEPPPQNIVGVEQSLTVPLRNTNGDFLEKPLVAVLDLLHRDENAGLTVTEFKTSGRRYGEFEADTTLQASCYAHAVQEKFGEPAAVKYTVLIKTKKPAIQRLETIRTEADLGRLGDIVQGIERAIAANAFYPVENPMNCAGCPYRLPCRDWPEQATPPRRLLQIDRQQEVARC